LGRDVAIPSAGGLVGPPLAGLVLDLVGRDTVAGWGLAFGHLALIH